MPKQLAVIAATASGKTKLALALAQKFNAAILSLDSLAVYKQIDIASAKPTREELASAPHFGIDEIYPNENFSVGAFFEIYKRAKEFAASQDRPLIITGGSGFYLKAMLCGLTPEVPKCETPNNAEIFKLAQEIDPKFSAKFSSNDSYRLEKWYQIYKFSGLPPSLWLEQNTSEPLIKELEIFEILLDKEILRQRITARTKQMLKDGLIDEAKFLFDAYGYETKSLKSVGLKECGHYLRGEISSQSELEELIATHTAQLAKRQRTFNRSQFKKRFSGDMDAVLFEAQKFLKDER